MLADGDKVAFLLGFSEEVFLWCVIGVQATRRTCGEYGILTHVFFLRSEDYGKAYG